MYLGLGLGLGINTITSLFSIIRCLNDLFPTLNDNEVTFRYRLMVYRFIRGSSDPNVID